MYKLDWQRTHRVSSKEHNFGIERYRRIYDISAEFYSRIRESVVPDGAIDAIARDYALHRLQQLGPRLVEVDVPRLQRHRRRTDGTARRSDLQTRQDSINFGNSSMNCFWKRRSSWSETKRLKLTRTAQSALRAPCYVPGRVGVACGVWGLRMVRA